MNTNEAKNCFNCGSEDEKNFVEINGKKIYFCLNCTRHLPLEPGEYQSEISHKNNAIKVFIDIDGEYFLTVDEADRFFRTALYPEEFFALIESGHSTDEFYLHSDFYDDIDGCAIQPAGKY